MNFNKKIGFICRNKHEWIECQKILFEKNFKWILSNQSKTLLNYPNNNPVILLNISNDKSLGWIYHFENVNCSTIYESNILLRKLKLQKLNEL